MQLPYLLEQRLEHLVVDRHRERTLLSAERSLHGPLAHAPLVLAHTVTELASGGRVDGY